MEMNIPMDRYIILPNTRKGRRYAHAHDMPHGRMSACNICVHEIMTQNSVSRVQAALVLEQYEAEENAELWGES